MTIQYNDTSTLNGIKQDLYFNGKFNAGTFNQNDLNRIINKYYLQAQMIIRGVNENFYAIGTLTNLLAGSNMQYSYPIDYEKIRFIEAAIQPANLTSPQRNEYVRCVLVTPEQIEDPSYQFSGPTCIMYGDYFEFVNTVANQVTNGLRMVYIVKQAQMVADSDTPDIFEDYYDVITWGALCDICPRTRPEFLATAKENFKQRKDDLAGYASARINGMAGGNIEGQIDAGEWQYPFGQNNGLR